MKLKKTGINEVSLSGACTNQQKRMDIIIWPWMMYNPDVQHTLKTLLTFGIGTQAEGPNTGAKLTAAKLGVLVQ